MEAFTQIECRKMNRVLTVTLSRPDRMNAWTATMEDEVKRAVCAADSDPEVRAIVLTGAGRAFCVGADLGGGEGTRGGDGAAQGYFEQRFSYFFSVGKPVIAAMNGPTAGVGLCISLFCDLRFIASGVRISTSFARRGLIAEHGSAWMLPRLIGQMNAMDLLLTGRTIDAKEAAALGLARELDAADFSDKVQTIAEELANLSSPRAMRVIKRQLHLANEQTLAEAWALADKEQAACFGTDDLAEGIASFQEKRPPAFTGT